MEKRVFAPFFCENMKHYKLTYEQLYSDLQQAYYDARRHKRTKSYQVRFEANLENNLHQLCMELYERSYKARPSTCFIISDPKKREVFAAEFRDRIVHHLYYNYTHLLYERTFITDTYSCIKGRGTHFGIRRLQRHIVQESQNYTVPCYVLKMDIRGYFMHINREHLLKICLQTLCKMALHRVSKHRLERWIEVVDYEFLEYLTREIVLLNPCDNCEMKGSSNDWDDLPHDKSLFHSPKGCGLPIGNLTSQLFSNVYLNVLDQFVKRTLRCKHYGRYVDDFYVVSADRDYLYYVAQKIKTMLLDELQLQFHDGKMRLVSVWQGVEFLGAYLKPYRSYTSRQTVSRMREKIALLSQKPQEYCIASLNSFCGVLSHGRNFHLREQLFLYNKELNQRFSFDKSMLKCQILHTAKYML